MHIYYLLLFSIGFISCSSLLRLNEQTPDWFLKSWEINSSKSKHAVSWVNNPENSNGKVLKFELRKNEAWSNNGKKSFRAEVSTEYYPPYDSIQRYEFDMYLPNNFPIENNRLVIAQWWSKTKKNLGEKPKSPTLALRYVSGRLYSTIRTSDQKIITNPDAIPSKEIFEVKDFKLGFWHHFVFLVRWNFKQDGAIKIWIDQKLVADYKGPVGYNDDSGPNMQFGICRDESSETYIAYFKNVHISSGNN